MDNDYKLIKITLSHADNALRVFKLRLSPTSLEAIASHITKNTFGMLAAAPKTIDLIPIIIGLMLKLTCEKEVQAFLKAEEAADATTDK